MSGDVICEIELNCMRLDWGVCVCVSTLMWCEHILIDRHSGRRQIVVRFILLL